MPVMRLGARGRPGLNVSSQWSPGTPPTLLSSFTTTFPATENPISQGGIWLNGFTDGGDWTNIQTTPGKMMASALDSAVGGVQDGVAQLKRSFLACTPNQFSQGTIFVASGYNPTGDHEVEVHSNLTINAHSITSYELYVNNSGGALLVRWDGPFNTFTPLANPFIAFTPPVDGDTIRLEHLLDGTLNGYQNGVLKISANDTTYFNGNPGMGNNPSTGGGVLVTGMGLKAWTGGSL